MPVRTDLIEYMRRMPVIAGADPLPATPAPLTPIQTWGGSWTDPTGTPVLAAPGQWGGWGPGGFFGDNGNGGIVNNPQPINPNPPKDTSGSTNPGGAAGSAPGSGTFCIKCDPGVMCPALCMQAPSAPGTTGGGSQSGNPVGGGGTAQTPGPVIDPIEAALLAYLGGSGNQGATGGAGSLPSPTTYANVSPAGGGGSSGSLWIFVILLVLAFGAYLVYQHFTAGAGVGGAIVGAITHKNDKHEKPDNHGSE